MENCMEALKPSLRGEIAVKATQKISLDDFLCLHDSRASGSSTEDFPVECFLDLSKGEFQEDDDEIEEVASSRERADDDSSSCPCRLSSDSHLSGELTLPVDESEELEWVSRFVDDSLSEISLLSPAKKAKAENLTELQPEPETVRAPALKNPSWPCRIPVKPRRKRTRNGTAGLAWPVGSLPLFQKSSSSSSGLSSSGLILTEIQKTGGAPVKRKQKERKPSVHTNGLYPFQRMCSHCGIQKTPQWRAGPLGAKTLCNACGVRYKSGRLLPEYRPASSPTFSCEIHSNSHRKVLELRRRKDLVGAEPHSTANWFRIYD